MVDAGQLQPAYILHSRPFRDTSLIVDAWCMYTGRQTILVKGARKAQGRQPAKRTLLQPFQPLQLSYGGRGEMGFLKQLEAAGVPLMLQGKALYSGIYINELILRLLPIADPHANIFAFYQSALSHLQTTQDVEPTLREFESRLLMELGYHLDLTCDMITKAPIVSSASYLLTPLQGVQQMPADFAAAGAMIIPGSALLALQQEAAQWSAQTRQVSKYIARLNLDAVLGDKPLRSRELFRQLHVPSKTSTTES
ncbi:MAG TPA: DNA repair protein RecO [Oceanospirillaceae bacterium]|nr:DNA repair protein RecO [Oceanospirillaceae bacterium]